MKKHLFFTLFATMLLTACQNKKQQNVSIIEEKKSLIQNWYGSEHFTVEKTQDTEEEEDTTSFMTPGGKVMNTPNPPSSTQPAPSVKESFFSHYLFEESKSSLEDLTSN